MTVPNTTSTTKTPRYNTTARNIEDSVQLGSTVKKEKRNTLQHFKSQTMKKCMFLLVFFSVSSPSNTSGKLHLNEQIDEYQYSVKDTIAVRNLRSWSTSRQQSLTTNQKNVPAPTSSRELFRFSNHRKRYTNLSQQEFQHGTDRTNS